MTPLAAFRDGVSRTGRAPWLLLGLYATLLALVVPLALVLRGMLATHLGGSLAAERAVGGVNFDWWNEFTAQAVGLGSTFTPSIIGFAAPLRNVADFADRVPLSPLLAAVIGLYLLVQTFLGGGAIDRLARNRPVGAAAFFAACGGHLFRLVRLHLVALVLYLVVLGALHDALFERLYPWLTHDVTIERTAFLIRATCYGLWLLPVIAVNLWIDYARIRLVVEDRRSALVALVASWRFLRRRPIRSVGIYVLNTLFFLLLLALYATVAPGATGGWSVWLGLATTQFYILSRLALRLVFAASQIAFFQSELAHATWVAAPSPEWPESPAAEAVQ